MTNAATDIDVTMLLCDFAQSVGGKLYIVGGGWSIIRKTEQPASMALAVKLAIPWSHANERHRVEAQLITDEGEPVEREGEAVRAEGNVEVGRPPGLRPGTPLDAAFVLNFQGLDLEPGGYVWELGVDGTVMARAPFQMVT